MRGECGEDGSQQISRDGPRDPVPRITLAGHRDTAGGREVYSTGKGLCTSPRMEKRGDISERLAV